MNQLSIFDPLRARKRDPDTSKSAAQSVSAFEADHFRLILAAIDRLGWATIHEIAHETGLDHVQVGRRCPEMAELVPHPTERRPSPSGRSCRVWGRK